ncbi:MAG: FtsH protease activity modulator HflK [Oceanicaulis sp.]
MPWNDNSGGGGPWGSGGGGNNNNPWGSGPRRPGGGQGGPGNEPDLEQLIKRLQDWLNGVFGGKRGGGSGGGGGKGGKGAGGLIGLLLIVAGVAWLLWPGNFYYIVGADQAGVVLRFGEYDRTRGSGPHVKLPYPVETVMLPEVTTTNSVSVGATDAESLMITQDENIVDVDFVVQWRVDLSYSEGVRDFLFNVRDPEGTVKAVAESAMREVVGTSDLIPIITTGRAEAATRAREIIQETLNSYQAGIQILEVQLSESSAPAAVIDAFRDVDRARQDAERIQLEARRDANQVVPEARGEAVRLLEEARGYREQVVAQAQGEASRFNAIYQEYAQAPDVTRRRMFLETMERVLGRSELIILDQNGNGQGAVPYLPLNELGRNRGARSEAPGFGQGGAGMRSDTTRPNQGGN